MDKIISFIIPSYNVEQYLEKCLSSFLNPQAIEQMEVSSHHICSFAVLMQSLIMH